MCLCLISTMSGQPAERKDSLVCYLTPLLHCACADTIKTAITATTVLIVQQQWRFNTALMVKFSRLQRFIIIVVRGSHMQKVAILMCVVVMSAYAQSYGGVFTYSWLAGYCIDQVQNKREACSHTQVMLWDNQSFTIHGIWPDETTTASFGAFNSSILPKEVKLLDDMQNYWPAKAKASTSNVFLWQHQWQAHGKDYAAILYKLKPESFPGTTDVRNAQLQLAFYKDVIAFYKRFNVKKLPSGAFTKSAFAHVLGLAETQFVFLCANSNIVKEMEVCFDITKTGITPKACSKASNCAGGGSTVQLPEWKAKGQSRVTNYPASPQLSTQ